MARIEIPEVEVMAIMDRRMLKMKALEKKVTKREKETLKILEEEVRKTRNLIRVMQNATIVMNMVFMLVNAGRSKGINQDMQMWLM